MAYVPDYLPQKREGERTPPGCKPGRIDITVGEMSAIGGAVEVTLLAHLASVDHFAYTHRGDARSYIPQFRISDYTSLFNFAHRNPLEEDAQSRFIDCARGVLSWSSKQIKPSAPGRHFHTATGVAYDRLALETHKFAAHQGTTQTDITTLLGRYFALQKYLSDGQRELPVAALSQPILRDINAREVAVLGIIQQLSQLK